MTQKELDQVLQAHRTWLTYPTEKFCDDRRQERASGIHHFITREEAVTY